jgi:putative RNA 2'-phosphotransferase
MESDPRRTVRLSRLSRFLSLLLRHRPTRFPLQLDEQGYADLRDVMGIVQKLPNFRWVTQADLDAVLTLPGRRRFELRDRKIRALYGHSAVRPTYDAGIPPETLYHGTSVECLESIHQQGILPEERSYVHLATTPELARSIALRHTADPVVLRVDAGAAHREGSTFYHPVEEIYLCDRVPPVYIRERVPVQAALPDIPDEE